MKVTQSCLTLCNPMDCIVHGVLQARILEWVAFPFSRGSAQPGDRSQISLICFSQSDFTLYFSNFKFYFKNLNGPLKHSKSLKVVNLFKSYQLGKYSTVKAFNNNISIGVLSFNRKNLLEFNRIFKTWMETSFSKTMPDILSLFLQKYAKVACAASLWPLKRNTLYNCFSSTASYLIIGMLYKPFL